ncbi:cytoplasmic protein [Kerstersia similis]|uniref:cytoplasmic protein n=1 Tax=Kerstersia similis TaxID=206505 RepID=UPI0039EF7BD3
MHTYRLIIQRHGKLLGHFESAVSWSRDAIADIASRFPLADGYQLELLIEDGERRIVESTPAGVRLLSREPFFKPAPWQAEQPD